ncbi:hypothetical protein ACFL6Y_11495, partial [Elusimicrobiota bacterium]
DLYSGTTNFEATFFTVGDHTVVVSPEADDSSVDSSTSAVLAVNVGGADRLLVIMPGEYHMPGQSPHGANTAGGAPGNPFGGKGGSAQNYTWRAGVSTRARVMATDAYWNMVDDNRSVRFETTIDNNVGDQTQDLVSGATDFLVTLFTAIASTGTYNYFTARDMSGGPFTPPTYRTTDFILLPSQTPSKLRVLADDLKPEPGTAGIKTGALSDKTAGIAFNVTIDVVDNWGNMVSSEPYVTVTTPDDDNDSIGAGGQVIQLIDSGSGGTTTFPLILATERTDDGSEATTPAASRVQADVSGLTGDEIAVEVDDDEDCSAASCLLLLSLSPQTYTEGSGLAGNPDPVFAGVQFQATIRTVDSNYNLIEEVSSADNNPTVTFDVLEDAGAATEADPNNMVLTRGYGVQDFILYFATNTVRLYVDNQGGTDYTDFTTSNLTASASDFFRLHTILPGQTYMPAQTPFNDGTGGKSGGVNTQIAGNEFSVDIYATDEYYNRVSSNVSVTVFTDDEYDTPPGGQTLSAGYRSFDITLKTSTDTAPSPNRVIAQTGWSDVVYGSSTHIPVNSSAPVALQILVPSESAVPGDTANQGKTGSVVGSTVGIAFDVTVRYVDQYYNKVANGTMPKVKILSDDTFADLPSADALVDGQKTFSGFYFKKASGSGWRIYASTTTDSTVSVEPSTSPYITAASSATTKLLAMLPGETYDPGNEANGGKDPNDTATTPQAGDIYTVMVYTTDKFYNPTVMAPEPIVRVITTDPNDQAYYPDINGKLLQSGSTTFDVMFRTGTQDSDAPRGPWVITASTFSANPLHNLAISSSSLINVAPGDASKLQILVQGESPDPGTSSGRSGEPDYIPGGGVDNFLVGVNFNAVVRIVDDYYNKNPNYSSTIKLNSNDANNDSDSDYVLDGTTPQGTDMGVTTFTAVRMRTKNIPGDARPGDGWIIQASTASGPGYEDAFSTWVVVEAGIPEKLIVILPGEEIDEGNEVGLGKKSGQTPTDWVAGSTGTVKVYVTDVAYNIVTSTNPTVYINFDPAGSAYDDVYAMDHITLSTRTIENGLTTFYAVMIIGEDKESKIVAASTNSLTTSESVEFTVESGNAEKFQILVPLQSAVPGKPPYDYGETAGGNDGAGIQSQPAGEDFDIEVRVVDHYWNMTAKQAGMLTLLSEDPVDIEPEEFQVNSSTIVIWTFERARTLGWKIAATGTLYTTTSPAISVAPGNATQVQVILPGEYYDIGSQTGKSGSPTPWIAGIASNVIVNAVDDYYNVVLIDNSQVIATANDDYDAPVSQSKNLSDGSTFYSFVLKTATSTSGGGGARIQMRDISGPGVEDYTGYSDYFTVNSSDPVKLQLIAEGESALPGSASGKTGALPDNQEAGAPFNVVVNAVDPYFNIVNDDYSQVYIETDDPYDVHPDTVSLIQGTTDFWVTMITESSWTVVVKDTDSYFTQASTGIYVAPANPDRFLVVLPGEYLVQGSTSGKS